MIKLSPRLQTRAPARASREQAVLPGIAEPLPTPEDAALTALLAIEVARYEIEATEAVLAIADEWLATHATTDRRYERAVRRRSVIETQHVIQRFAAWTACCQLWRALEAMAGPRQWVVVVAPHADTESVEAVWRSWMGERVIPFGVRYPAALAVPPWMGDELSERREKQRAKATQRATPRKTKRGGQ